MKTIVLVDTNESLILEADDVPIELFDNKVVIGTGSNTHVIWDRNKHNVRVYEGVTAPDDWFTYKYTFDGQSWAPNQDFHLQQAKPE
jgi:hypothetical protein